jgi:hypothetical protein
MMLRRANRAWTADDEAKLKEMAARGLYLRNIALRLRRSESSIIRRARELGVKIERTPRFRGDRTIRG